MQKYSEIVNKLDISDAERAALLNAKIAELEASEDGTRLSVTLEVVASVCDETAAVLAAALEKIFHLEVHLQLLSAKRLSYAAFCINPRESLSECELELPSLVWRALSNAECEATDDNIVIKVSNATIERLLLENSIVEIIKRFIYTQTDYDAARDFAVTIVVGEHEDYSEIQADLASAAQEASYSQSNNSSEHNQSSNSYAPNIIGKAINQPPRRIMDVLREVTADNTVAADIEGRLTGLDTRKLGKGSILATFSVVDETEAMRCKIFVKAKDEATVLPRIKNGLRVKLAGNVRLDMYERNAPVLEPSSIVLLPQPAKRVDEHSFKRVELHCHTNMSSLDAVVTASDIVNTAARWEHPAVAITDHGVVQSFPEAAATAAKFNKCAAAEGRQGIKVIYGVEGYLMEDDQIENPKAHLYHVIILAANKIGLKNLYRLISDSHILRYKKRPRIARQDLQRCREGLIIGSACEAGELFHSMVNGANDDKLRDIAGFYDYLEIQPVANNAFLLRRGLASNYEHLQLFNKKIVAIGEELGIPVVATTDAHFLNPEDEIYRKIILTVKGMEDGSQPLPLYFRTTQEMLEEFSYLGTDKAEEVVIKNSNIIADKIEALNPIPSQLFLPKIAGSKEEIERMANENALRVYGNPLPDVVRERLELELNSIIGHGFDVLYLIAHKLVKKSNEEGYLVGSRGSVGSSLVATMTGITEVNPLPPHWLCPGCRSSVFAPDGLYANGYDMPDRVCVCGTSMQKNGHNIPFAVFMGFEGDKIPDIDLNFSGEYQAKIHKYTEELLGKKNVFRAGTISTVAEKNAIGFAKKYFEVSGIHASEQYVAALSEGCVGVKRTTGQHPGGLMVLPDDMDIYDITPIQHPAEAKDTETVTTHFDYHSIHDTLVKLDNLGHDVPTIIKDLYELSGIDPSIVPFDDAATLSLFSSTKAIGLKPEQLLGSTVATFGVPEFGTKFVREMLRDTNPVKFSELVRISGFSHGTDVWLGNAKDLIVNKTATVGEVISARDDIMLYLIAKGLERKHAFKIMENVRKGKGLSEDDISAMKKAAVPGWYIDSCQKIKYLFPKAHAAAYVMMAFRIAYFKVHHPLAFYAASFSVKAEDFDAHAICSGFDRLKQEYELIERKGKEATGKEETLLPVMELALEMYARGYEFLKVDVRKSHYRKFTIVDGKIAPPLCSLNGLGANAALNIDRERDKGTFSSIEDLQNRARLNKTVIEVLRTHGCLDGMDETDQMTLF